jgi:hypothetical protein
MNLNKRLANLLFVALMLAYAVYAAIFISKTIFTIDGTPYTSLFDDSMISMTYARNLAQGFGPVWNPGGAPIEGYTNPLWVVFMAAIHLLPIPETMTSLAVQISGALFVLASLFFLKKIVERVANGNNFMPLLALVMTAFYYPLTNWSLIGTEVSVLLLIVNVSVWMALKMMDEGRFSWQLYLIMGIGTLVRTDMAVTFLTVCGFLFLVDGKNRWKHLAWGAGMLALFLGGQTLWRKAYYGEWLPMTYYLKMSGWPLLSRISRGWAVLVNFATTSFVPVLIFPITIFLFRRDRKVIFLALVFLAQVVYSVYVGGDAWENRGGSNRFIALGMPAFLTLYAMSAYYFYDLGRKLAQRWLPKLKWVIQPGALLVLFFFLLGSWAMLNKFLDFGAPWMNLRDLENGALRYADLAERSIFMPGSERYTRDGLMIKAVTNPNATVAVVAAGNVCYFAHRTCIDEFGKSDAVIAKGPIMVPLDSDWQTLRPGHVKWNYAYSLGELKPDVVSDIRAYTDKEAEAYLPGYQKIKMNGHFMYFKTGSPNINWEELQNERDK